MTDQPKPDLELATTDELWTELASRHEAAMLLWFKAGKTERHNEWYGSRYHGNEVLCRGLLAFAREELDHFFRCNLEAGRQRQAEAGEEDP